MKNPGGRPSYKPTDKDRRTVKALAGFGTSHEDIAQTIGIDPKTLRKHFRKELDAGVIEANAKVAQSLFVRATTMSGNPSAQVTAAIWWSKARMGWSEKTKTEVSGPDGGAIPIEDARAVLADRLAAIAAKPDDEGEARTSRKPS